MEDTADSLQHNFRSAQYLLVLWPDPDAKNRVPERTSHATGSTIRAGEEYTPGEFHGWLVAVDQRNGSLGCAGRIDAFSSREIYHRHYDTMENLALGINGRNLTYDDEKDTKNEIRRDFERRLKEAIENAAPKGLNVYTSFGPIL